MVLDHLEFGSLLSYCPRGGTSGEIGRSRQIMISLKNDSFVEDPPIPMSSWVSRTIELRRSELPFNSLFQSNAVLVPLPRSSLLQPDSLWVPDRIAQALLARGFGSKLLRCISRSRAVRKSASSPAEERPSPSEHYETMTVQGSIEAPSEIVLVDDIVTRGHTMLGAANKLLEVFPTTHIRAFAAMRTVSNWRDFLRIYDPQIGSIEYREDRDDCVRRP